MGKLYMLLRVTRGLPRRLSGKESTCQFRRCRFHLWVGKIPCRRKQQVKVLVAQSCLTLCNPTDYSQPGSSVHGILHARILEWVAIPFSRGIFLTQGLNPGLPLCRQILYHLSHQGIPGLPGKSITEGGELTSPAVVIDLAVFPLLCAVFTAVQYSSVSLNPVTLLHEVFFPALIAIQLI